MKKFYIIIFLFSMNLIHAQEKKDAKIKIIGYGGIGYGIMKSDSEPSYNLYTNYGELLLNYKFNKNFGIATGLGFNEFSGNGFNSIGNFYHERKLLKVPVLVTMDYNFTDKLLMLAGFGLYTQTIIKDEYRFLNNTITDIYDGWSFGVEMNFGFVYQFKSNLGFGINFNLQSDFTKISANTGVSLNDKQKIKSLNSIGIILIFDL